MFEEEITGNKKKLQLLEFMIKSFFCRTVLCELAPPCGQVERSSCYLLLFSSRRK